VIMRHPAAPTIIVILLGFLVLVIVYHAFVRDGHHEGNPHPDDVPKKEDIHTLHGEEDDDVDADDKKEE
jgi:hypothetical protein